MRHMCPAGPMTYMCPVCGYDKLSRPPEDHLICPCCGTQFEYDDCNTTHAELRAQWVAAGCQWFSQVTQPPKDWDVTGQLAAAQSYFALCAAINGLDPDVF